MVALRCRAPVARQAHNLEVGGSTPPTAIHPTRDHLEHPPPAPAGLAAIGLVSIPRPLVPGESPIMVQTFRRWVFAFRYVRSGQTKGSRNQWNRNVR